MDVSFKLQASSGKLEEFSWNIAGRYGLSAVHVKIITLLMLIESGLK